MATPPPPHKPYQPPFLILMALLPLSSNSPAINSQEVSSTCLLPSHLTVILIFCFLSFTPKLCPTHYPYTLNLFFRYSLLSLKQSTLAVLIPLSDFITLLFPLLVVLLTLLLSSFYWVPPITQLEMKVLSNKLTVISCFRYRWSKEEGTLRFEYSLCCICM